MGLFGGKDGVKLKKRSAGAMAYIEYRGPYNKVPFDECFKKLYDWAKQARVRPGFTPFVVYPNDPKITPESDLLTQVAIPIAKEVPASGEVKVSRLCDMEIATLKHNAPAEEYNKSYAELQKWISDNGYELFGSPMEIYTGKPKMNDGKMIIYSEIQFPVRKK